MFTFIKNLKPTTSTLGIEISDHYIKLAEIIPLRNDTYSLHNYLIEKLPENVVKDGRIKEPMKVILTLQSMIASLNTKAKHVHIVLPSQLVMVRFLKLPDIPLKDLRKLVDFEMKHNIHLPFDKPIFDFVKLNSNEQKKVRSFGLSNKNKETAAKQEAMRQSAAASNEAAASLSEVDNLFADHERDAMDKPPLLQCDVMLVAVPQQLIEEYQEVFTSTSLKLLSIEFKALSLFRLIQETDMIDISSTFMTVDISDELTDISIFDDRQLKITRNIPMKFISNSSESESTDEAANLMFLQFMDQDSDFNNACNDLSHEIERVMNFYRYTLNHRDKEFTHVLISGDTPRLAEIAKVLEERLTSQVSVMSTNRVQSPHLQFAQIFPSIAVPVGLALRGRQR